jgi:transposase-like protein
MAQVLHGSATTTAAVRRAIQQSQESLRALAKRYGINQKTVAKWKRRTSARDLPHRAKGGEIHGALGRGSSLLSADTHAATSRRKA